MWLNRRDDEIDDGSSSGMVDEGRRGVAVDDVVGEEASARWRTDDAGVSRLVERFFWRPWSTNGELDEWGGTMFLSGMRLFLAFFNRRWDALV